MKHFSCPVDLSSTSRGRSLLEWFCGAEGFCCYMAAYKPLLPLEWRSANVTIRRQMAMLESQIVSPTERKSRLLADLWAEYWVFVHQLIEILSRIPKDRNQRGYQTTRDELLRTLKTFNSGFLDFFETPEVKEVLEIMEIQDDAYNSYLSSHGKCCPDVRPIPLLHRFPLAGFFRLLSVVLRVFVKSIVYPSLHADDDFDDVETGIYAVECCRTYAGIEYQMDAVARTFPCFSPILLAALAVPNCGHLRGWLMSKFTHFGEEGQLYAHKTQEKLCKVWDMPQDGSQYFSILSERHCDVEEVVRYFHHVHISDSE